MATATKTPAKKTAPKKTVAKNPDAVAFLESQHREVEALFKKLEDAGDDATKTKLSLFQEIAQKLGAHAQLEETILYPEGKPIDPDMTLEAYEEHDVVKALIAKIEATDPSDETFMAKCTVLKEVVEHHVEEEEEAYFPELAKKLGKERMQELGAELEAAFAALASGEEAQKKPALKAASKLR